MNATFNADALRSTLLDVMAERRKSYRDIADETGVSPATISRVLQGEKPSVETLAALVGWMDVRADRFIVRRPT